MLFHEFFQPILSNLQYPFPDIACILFYKFLEFLYLFFGGFDIRPYCGAVGHKAEKAIVSERFRMITVGHSS